MIRRLALAAVMLVQSTSLAGAWKGTSICLARKPICKDEVVVYHFTADSGDARSYHVAANKIVGGAEEEMGVLPCRLDDRGTSVSCTMRLGVWTFDVRGDSLVGGLTLTDGTKVRDVHVRRVPPSPTPNAPGTP